MIGVRLEGRLGNQLFQYALAFANSKRKGTFFFIDQLKWNFIAEKYFTLPTYRKILNSIRTISYYKLYKNKFSVCTENENYDFLNLMNFGNNSYFMGYFQSEKYFAEYKEQVVKEFRVKPSWKNLFEQKYSDVFKNNKTIAVHVRKGDYTDMGILQGNPRDMSLPDAFFMNCLHEIENLEKYKILFVSDDIEYCKKAFGHLPNAFFEHNDMIVDLQIMTHADVCIISHSSFSWWGAYLNNKADKKVFAPKNWLGFKDKFENPSGIMSVKWNWTEVE
jgi:hypothetical protein